LPLGQEKLSEDRLKSLEVAQEEESVKLTEYLKAGIFEWTSNLIPAQFAYLTASMEVFNLRIYH